MTWSGIANSPPDAAACGAVASNASRRSHRTVRCPVIFKSHKAIRGRRQSARQLEQVANRTRNARSSVVPGSAPNRHAANAIISPDPTAIHAAIRAAPVPVRTLSTASTSKIHAAGAGKRASFHAAGRAATRFRRNDQRDATICAATAAITTPVDIRISSNRANSLPDTPTKAAVPTMDAR